MIGFRASLLLLVLAGLIAGAAAPARAQVPAGCQDVLLGDSLAVGMGPHARQRGFSVIAREGAGMSWLRQQQPPCAGLLIVVFGTNDLRAIDGEAAAEAYVREIIAITNRWDADRIVWATPGCFDRDARLEAGSDNLDRTLARIQAAGLWTYRFLPAVNRGRADRCRYESRDGVHPAGTTYEAWWAGIAARIARRGVVEVAPGGQDRPAARTSLSQPTRSFTPMAAIQPSQPSAIAIRPSVPGTSGRP
jgi:lysophospholipase L1-like esterase